VLKRGRTLLARRGERGVTAVTLTSQLRHISSAVRPQCRLLHSLELRLKLNTFLPFVAVSFFTYPDLPIGSIEKLDNCSNVLSSA
jgi:hypothetical protein